MAVKLTRLLVVVTLVISVSMHWTLLQSVAWVGMVVNYTQNGSFKEALAKTFDGRHPCKLCLLVKDGKQSEQKRPTLKSDTRWECFLELKDTGLFPPLAFSLLSVPDSISFSRSDTPPVPPPRAV